MTELKPFRNEKGVFVKKHGMFGTRLYHIWNGLNGRCNNPNNKDYPDYGGRGIKVCQEWRTADNFFKWAKESGYADDLSIDRIDNNKDYCPTNCRWMPMSKQQRNKRNNKLIEFNGETHCIAEWAEITGIASQTINSRLRYGWTIDEALTIKPSHKNNIHKAIEAWNRRAE